MLTDPHPPAAGALSACGTMAMALKQHAPMIRKLLEAVYGFGQPPFEVVLQRQSAAGRLESWDWPVGANQLLAAAEQQDLVWIKVGRVVHGSRCWLTVLVWWLGAGNASVKYWHVATHVACLKAGSKRQCHALGMRSRLVGGQVVMLAAACTELQGM